MPHSECIKALSQEMPDSAYPAIVTSLLEVSLEFHLKKENLKIGIFSYSISGSWLRLKG